MGLYEVLVLGRCITCRRWSAVEKQHVAPTTVESPTQNRCSAADTGSAGTAAPMRRNMDG